jgi:anaerobic selenocysteine-containing dehydrogenase
MTEIIKTFCKRMCSGICGINVFVENGKITRVEGDPDCEFNKGFVCSKGRAIPELLYHPERLKHPMRRIGEKGVSEWKRISVDEALDIVANKLKGYIDEYGEESILFFLGAYRGLERAFVQRFASVIGTPNTITIDNVCHAPRILAARYTYGGPTQVDYEHPPECLIVWGRNSLRTGSEGSPAQYRHVFEGGTKIIVIDPRKIPQASGAEMWIKPRPGSDGLLALAFLNVIINEGLYDADFVEDWTVGFEKLQEFVADYTPDKVAERTWVPRDQIEQAARMYATAKSAAIQWGNALDQTSNSFQTLRAIAIMRAITGNLDVPGGEYFPGSVPTLSGFEFGLFKNSVRTQKTSIGSQYKVSIGANIVPSQEAMKTILKGEPYPVKAGLIFGSNPMLTYANAAETHKALKKLDFLVVAELFMTPTAELADLILPVAANLEYNDLMDLTGCLAARPKVVDPPGECRSDLQWINELASRMGYGEYFWEDEASAFDVLLQPSGMKYDDLMEKDIVFAEKKYKKYIGEGFKTPTGKVELYSEKLTGLGLDPLPTYNEPPETPFGSPKLAEEYPLVLTSYKNPNYYHASHRNIPSLRKLSPKLFAELNPETCTKLDLKDGDIVYIETPRGRIKQRIKMNADLAPRIVVVAYGWWFPERGPPSLYGWKESNLNMLTDNEPPLCPAMGSTNLRGILCKVYKEQ